MTRLALISEGVAAVGAAVALLLRAFGPQETMVVRNVRRYTR